MADNDADISVSLGARNVLPIEQCRILILFGYEIQGGRASPLWHDPFSFINAQEKKAQELDKIFQAWLQTKRPFTEDEVRQSTWLKIADDSGVFYDKHELHLFPNGSLRENELNRPHPSWDGRWLLVDGVLRIKINDYELDVFARKDG